MKKLRIVLCTLFAAAIVGGTSAVSAFAELYVRSSAIADNVNEHAENIWKDNKFVMQYGMDDRSKAEAVKLEQGFFVKGLGKSTDRYLYPVTSSGEIMAFVCTSEEENGKLSYGFLNFDFGFNSLATSAGSPADIYVVNNNYFAVIDGEYFTIEEYDSKKIGKNEKDAAVKLIKEYRKENPSNGKYIHACGFSQNGWRTVDGNKYFIKRNGILAKGWQTIGDDKYYFDKDCAAVTKDTTVSGKRYRFGKDGKLLGTYTGFLTSGEKQYYYKKGVKQTGDFTVDGKNYHADKNGVISKK